MRILTTLLSLTLALPVAAQLKVSVMATNDAGIALDKAAPPRVVQNLASNTPFTKYARVSIYERSPYSFLSTTVCPPITYYNGMTYNRALMMASAYARKNSTHKSLHTTGNKNGDPGVQKYQITLTSATSTKVAINWYACGYIYDSSTASVKFTVGTTTKSWTWTKPGYNRENGQIVVTVNGTTTITAEINGLCKPGTGTGGNSYYDGFYSYLNMRFVETNNGSFTVFGKGCSKGKIGGKGVPTRGSRFDITYTGGNANQSCALLYGYSKDYYQFIKLPLDLSYMGANGCFLNVSFGYPWYRQTDAQGNASASVYLSSWASGTYYVQWLIWDPKNTSGALTLSEGAAIKY